MDGLDRTPGLRLLELARAQQRGPSYDRVERRPQLVRHEREELVLHANRALGGLPVRNMPLQLVALLRQQLALTGDSLGLDVQRHQDRDLRSQNLGIERLREVV